ncbi:hypothetical protein JK202_04010 [Gluconobacter sp. Dm-62]|nr:hypothetical protein [Gluconobacter sp. Dm-62]
MPFQEEKNLEQVQEIIEISDKKKFSEQELEESYKKGFREGQKTEKEISENEKKELIHDSFKEISNNILEIQRIIEESKNDISKNVSFLLMNIFVNLFPNIIESYGFKESQKMFEKIIPIIRSKYGAKLMCSKGFMDTVKMNLPGILDKKLDFLVDDSIKDGDFKIFWDSGHLFRSASKDIEKIISEIFLLT